MKEYQKTAKDMLDFIEKSPTCFHAVANVRKALTEAGYAELAEAGVDFLDMGAVYDAKGHRPEYYSAVDHHYSCYGAYAAYRAILDHLAEAGRDLPVLTE